jgi:hypothetical protein
MEKKESEIMRVPVGDLMVLDPLRLPQWGPQIDPPPPCLTGLLTKGRIAEIVVHQYEMKINELRGQINELRGHIGLFELAQNLLIEEHGIDYKRPHE